MIRLVGFPRSASSQLIVHLQPKGVLDENGHVIESRTSLPAKENEARADVSRVGMTSECHSYGATAIPVVGL